MVLYDFVHDLVKEGVQLGCFQTRSIVLNLAMPCTKSHILCHDLFLWGRPPQRETLASRLIQLFVHDAVPTLGNSIAIEIPVANTPRVK